MCDQCIEVEGGACFQLQFLLASQIFSGGIIKNIFVIIENYTSTCHAVSIPNDIAPHACYNIKFLLVPYTP